MVNSKGNRTKVLHRWYGKRKWSDTDRKPRRPFEGDVQFTLDDVYITPFTHELTTDKLGRTGYTPLKHNLEPTGIHVFDAYIQELHAGTLSPGTFCKSYQATTYDLDGFIFLLTGMSNTDFRSRWILHTADLLLRYTNMKISEIAHRSGAGTRNNLYFMYERDFNCSPTQRRYNIRQPGDLGHYRIIEERDAAL